MDDVYSWEQTLSQGLLLSVDHSTLGSVDLPGSPIRLDDQPHLRWPRAPPRSPDARPAQRVDPGVARGVSRDWHAWHDEYDDPTSSLSRRLEVVRAELRTLLVGATSPVRLVSMCAGDGRDTLPVIAESPTRVSARARRARPRARRDGPHHRPFPGPARGGRPHRGCWHHRLVRRRRACRRPAGVRRVRQRDRRGHGRDDRDPAGAAGARSARDLDPRPARASGPDSRWRATRARPSGRCSPRPASRRSRFVRPDDASFRVGVARWAAPGRAYRPGVRMFSFV